MSGSRALRAARKSKLHQLSDIMISRAGSHECRSEELGRWESVAFIQLGELVRTGWVGVVKSLELIDSGPVGLIRTQRFWN